MEISSASTLKGFAVLRREGVNPQPAGTEGVDGNNTGISNAIADVIDISTEGRSFANQEERNKHSAGQGGSPLFGNDPENPTNHAKSTITKQQSGGSAEVTITAAVLTGESDNEVPLLGEDPEEGNRRAQAGQRQAPKSRGSGIGQELTAEEKQTVIELKQRDAEVRAHEQAHLAAAGQYASGGIHYEYQRGPDGRQYAIGGEVGISMPSGSSPEESLRIARQVERAANAPASPSSADRAIAAAARAKASAAIREMSKETLEKAKSNRETNNSSDGVTLGDGRPEGQEIPITGTGQPHNEPATNSGQVSNPETPVFGRVSDTDTPPAGNTNQNDESGIQANRAGATGIQGGNSYNDSVNQSSEDSLPELIDLINGLDGSSTTDDDRQFGEKSDSESAGNRDSLQSLLSLVDSL